MLEAISTVTTQEQQTFQNSKLMSKRWCSRNIVHFR